MRAWKLVALACLCIGCAPDEPQQADRPAADTVSQAARDSAIARSRLPGASAVGKALDVSGTAQERAATLDSIR